MTDAQLNALHERIAESLGWKRIKASQWQPDGTMVWIAPDGTRRFKPPDFTRDETANAMLLDAMAADSSFCCVEVNRDVPAKVWTCILRLLSMGEHDLYLLSVQEHDEHRPHIACDDEDRKTVVVLAACAWKGIEVPE